MTVVVLGGGITGLASAHALGAAGVPTVLLEVGTIGEEQRYFL